MTSIDFDWTAICSLDDILPDTGVCARVADRTVAIYRVGAEALHAIDNVDPKNGAGVLSRGLVGNLGDRLVVASPLYKHQFDLCTGECLEHPELRVAVHRVRVEDGCIFVAIA